MTDKNTNFSISGIACATPHSYHKKFNEKLQVYSDEAQYDFSSHAADATRYLAMALKLYGNGTGSLTKDRID